eukprot:TRINITY_DN23875_c0_g1_i4.p1 TRINITY_DN23875_c0_g1~~TRINITY_DN23875_c0_g1_i4.p1  ORF type:complete len:215 (+),score=54.68 TRINITY_DN23875_c0_g1_i4:157-801(+)
MCIRDRFLGSVQSVFGLRRLELEEVAAWPGALQGPSRDSLPDALCSNLFMRGNPAADAIGDPTHGSWDDATKTLSMPLWKPGVWSWNNDFEGAKLFYGAWAMGMTYVFQFDDKIERATIASPILNGALQFTDLVYGKGSEFTMYRDPGATVWTRHSVLGNGTEAFGDYFPTRVVSCKGGAVEASIELMLASLKDHKKYNPKSVSGGASSTQMLR